MSDQSAPQQGPAPEPRPRPPFDFSKFDELMAALQRWRNDDHEDYMPLHRNQIIKIIDGVEALQRRNAR